MIGRIATALLLLASVASAAAQNLHAVPDSGTATFGGGTYAYDPSGNIIAVDNQTFLYDTTGRLTQATVMAPDRSMVTQNFTYDLYGNLLTMSRPGATQTMTVDESTNQLTNTGAAYDAAGNLTQWTAPGTSTTYQYGWDPIGNLQSIRLASSPSTDPPAMAYIYTASDERLWIFDVPNDDSHFTIRDLGGQVLTDFHLHNGTWSWARDYFYRDGTMLASAWPDLVQHYSVDHLGTPRLITDDQGHQIAAQTFLPFGEELQATFADGAAIKKFTGHERDSDIGATGTPLDYMHARYYGGVVGRFLSVDPTLNLKRALREPQNWNRYSYVMNNPLRYTDPDGRDHYQEPGLTVPTSQWGTALAMDENTPAVVQGAFYAEGALLGMAAGGGAAVRAYQALQYASLVFATSFPALYNAAQSYLSGETGTPSLGGFRAAGSAIGKAETTAAKFGMTRDALVTSVVKNGARFVDQSHGTVNMFMKRPDGKSGFVRVTIDATGKILSVGLNTAANLKKGITERRWIPF